MFEHLGELKLHELTMGFNKVKHDIKNEKLLMYFLLHFLLFNPDVSLETISFI